MASTARGLLRAELTARLVPALRGLGFEGPAAISGNALLHDYRRRTEQGVHHLSVQLEKHGLPRFVVNLWVEPVPEAANPEKPVMQGRLKARRGPTTRSWFRADPTWWQRWTGRGRIDAAGAVDACLRVLPEMEAWWGTQVASEHIDAWAEPWLHGDAEGRD